MSPFARRLRLTIWNRSYTDDLGRRSMKPLLALMVLGMGGAWAQNKAVDKPALRARELFYTPPPEAAVATPPATPTPPAPKVSEIKPEKKAAPKRNPAPVANAQPPATP